MNFRPDIEGLRALAIVPVVVFHAFPSLMPGGYVGVDIFFVISGFLITSVLMQRLDAGQYSLVSFYAARIRRIFPALFAMLVVVTPIALCLLSPTWLWEFRRTLAATALFLSNMELYQRSGYFETSTELKPLVHTWSLAVEEQYYIVFPMLLAMLYTRWRAAIVPVLALLGLASLLVSAWWLRTDPSLAFYSSVSRTFELMIGSVLAVAAARWVPPSGSAEGLAALGLASVLGSLFLISPSTPFPGFVALFPCVGTALIIWTGHHATTRVGTLLTLSPFRWIGALSFSLYLWHWPVLVFARHWTLGELTAAQSCAAVVVSVVLARL